MKRIVKRKITIEELKSLEGKKFGRLTILKYDHSIHLDFGSYKDYYKAHCDCGNDIFVERYALISGHTTSCGCLQKEIATNIIKYASYKHGMVNSDPKFYNAWISMIQRCSKPYDASYQRYGGRGIGVDFLWFDFINFYKDMYPSYLDHISKYGPNNTSLERKDVNDMYCKENCTWATMEEQINNRTISRRVEYNGKMYTCRELLNTFPHHESINCSLLYARIFHLKMNVDKALSLPKRINNYDD